MYLHKDYELFREVILSTSDALGVPIPIIEKDYYVTMILKLMAERASGCVFKGGTSLSKCHHVIDRFSEDIDITFMEQLTAGARKTLKNDVIAGISAELDLPISDWENARSRRDYNCYTFQYTPIEGLIPQSLIPGVKLEVSLASLAFPTQQMAVDSYVYQFLQKENQEIIDEYGLTPFLMTLQTLDRTLADKVFAICDYYLEGKTKRHSRHIYDIYMLLPHVPQDDDFRQLIQQVREQRSHMSICPSAKPGVDIPALLREIIEKGVYRDDYRQITSYFQNKPLEYEEAIRAVKSIAEGGLF